MLATLLYMLVTLTADRNTRRQQRQLPISRHLKALKHRKCIDHHRHRHHEFCSYVSPKILTSATV